MIVSIGVVAQLASATPTYATPAVRQIVEAARVENHQVPRELSRYQARVETSASSLFQMAMGRELLWGSEQFAWQVSWSRGEFVAHLVGRRGFPFAQSSGITGAPAAWMIPHLYGDRFPIALVVGRDSAPVRPVHPFASDGDRWYTFSGGDTVATIRRAYGVIPVVMVHVRPRADVDSAPARFDGDVLLDASRFHIIRLTGRFIHRARAGNALDASIDVENAEVEDGFWLPRHERVEMELRSPLLIAPFVSRLDATFRDYRVFAAADSDSTASTLKATVTQASDDSLHEFDKWVDPLPAFNPDGFREINDRFNASGWFTVGVPTFRVGVSSPANALHYNTIEGVFTGTEVAVLPAAVPLAWRARVNGGFAWAEQTIRGGVAIDHRYGAWMQTVEAKRALISTSDFPLSETLDRIRDLAQVTRRDYVDRSSFLGQLAVKGDGLRPYAGLSAGLAQDHDVVDHARSLFSRGDSDLPNRFARSGTYSLISVEAGWGQVAWPSSDSLGVGTILHAETARGELTWQRVTVAAGARVPIGPLRYEMRLDAGLAGGRTIPPQQLFELGGTERLPGYRYKQFIGDRAAAGSASLELPMRWLDRTARGLSGTPFFPPFAPALRITVQGAQSQLRSDGAREAAMLISRSATIPAPIASGGIVGGVGLGMTAFSGLLHLGVARPLTAVGRWRPSIGLSNQF
jgi:hypothetical protein